MNSKFTLQSTKRIFRFAIRFPGFFFGLFGGDETAGHRIREVLKMGDLRLRWSVFFASKIFRQGSSGSQSRSGNSLRIDFVLSPIWVCEAHSPPSLPMPLSSDGVYDIIFRRCTFSFAN